MERRKTSVPANFQSLGPARAAQALFSSPLLSDPLLGVDAFYSGPTPTPPPPTTGPTTFRKPTGPG